MVHVIFTVMMKVELRCQAGTISSFHVLLIVTHSNVKVLFSCHLILALSVLGV